jgi:long-chain acyl-CoA synthetase
LEELCKNKKVETMILKDLETLAKDNQLPSFERAKHIYLHPEMFSVENGLLTPTVGFGLLSFSTPS